MGVAFNCGTGCDGGGNELRNNLFSANLGTAGSCDVGVVFSARDNNDLWSNAANGCVWVADLATRQVDPLYVQ